MGDCLDKETHAELDVLEREVLAAKATATKRYPEARIDRVLQKIGEAAGKALEANAPPCKLRLAAQVAVLLPTLRFEHHNRLLAYAGRHLDAIMSEDTLPAERALGAYSWSRVIEHVPDDRLLQVLERWCDHPARKDEAAALGTFLLGLGRQKRKKLAEDALVVAAELCLRAQFEGREDPRDAFEAVGPTLVAALERDRDLRKRCGAWVLATVRGHRSLPSISEMARILELAVDERLATELATLDDDDPQWWFQRRGRHLVHRLAEAAPEAVASVVGAMLRTDHELNKDPLKNIAEAGLGRAAAHLIPELAKLLAGSRGDGVDTHHPLLLDRHASVKLVAAGLTDDERARLDRAARALVDVMHFENRDSQRASAGFDAQAQLVKFVSKHPKEWAELLRVMPLAARTSETRSWVEALTMACDPDGHHVPKLEEYAALPEADLRDWARDWLAHRQAVERVDAGAAGDLLSAVARHVDGRPTYPHPLAVRSGTWLASHGAEEVIERRVREAVGRFGQNRRPESDEAALTRDLLVEIRRSLEDVKDILQAMARLSEGRQPTLLIRQETNAQQRGSSGVDAAVIVQAHLPNAMRFKAASLVLAKKAAAKKDAWDIDVKELGDVLNLSDAAVYWLYGPGEETHVVPARLLRALIAGSDRLGGISARVQYVDIRSMSIPIEQYVMLLLGGWLASTAKRTLAVAEGDDPQNKPAAVLSVIFANR